MTSPVPPCRRRLCSTAYIAVYIACVLPLWYNAVRVHRVPLPYGEIDELGAALGGPLAGALPVTITAYVVCQGGAAPCLGPGEVSAYARELGRGVLREAGLAEERAPLTLRVVQDSPGDCLTATWAPTHGSASPAPAPPTACLRLASSAATLKRALGLGAREWDDWAAQQLAAQGQDRPGSYHLFLLPDPWVAPAAPPAASVGRHRSAALRYAAAAGPAGRGVAELAAAVAGRAFAAYLGPPPHADLDAPRLPLSPAAQLHLALTLAHAHPAPGGGGGGSSGGGGGDGGSGGGADRSTAGGGGSFAWPLPSWEAQYLGPVKAALGHAARVTVSSQVLYFTPGRVKAAWDPALAAHTLPAAALPFFADSDWQLDPTRAASPYSTDGGLSYDGGGGWDAPLPYDVDLVPAGSRPLAVGEAVRPAAGAGLSGSGGQAAADAAAAAALPPLLPPAGGEGSGPAAVLRLVLWVPPPGQRPTLVPGPEGRPAPGNSFRVPGWGMVQVLNQPPPPAHTTVEVGAAEMQAFAVEALSSLRSLLGLGAARRALLAYPLPSDNATAAAQQPGEPAQQREREEPASGDPRVSDPAAHQAISVLSALRSGLAPWEVDALLRRRVGEDVAAAGQALRSLVGLLRQVPTLSVPAHVGARVRGAAAALRAALGQVAAGAYHGASRAAQEARSRSEAAWADPALGARLNVPDTHAVGVYLPFCLPAAVPLAQALLSELRRLWRARGTGGGKGRKEGKGGGAAGDKAAAPHAGAGAEGGGEPGGWAGGGGGRGPAACGPAGAEGAARARADRGGGGGAVERPAS